MPDGSDLGVTPAADVSISAFVAYNPIFTSLSSAVSIGGLSEDQSDISVVSGLSAQAPVDIYTFNFESGSAIKLDFNNTTATTDLRVQVLNILGNVVADNEGDATQQAAYGELTSSSGLAASNGKYYVKISYAPEATVEAQSYDFQLYSGTTYSSSFVTTALIQAYDPNLFVDAADSVTPATNLQLYTRTANLATTITASGSTPVPVNIGQLVANQSELAVQSKVTATAPKNDYTFDFKQSGAIKLALENDTDTALLHVQLLDSSGKVLADNRGTDDQKNAYIKLTSGVGLQAASGQYSLKVGFAAGQLTGTPQDYNFQLLAGTTYNTVYKTAVAQPASEQTYSAGTGLNVYAAADAQLFSRHDFNKIGATAASAVNIGWLKENTSSLAVRSRLTTEDHTDYYNFTLQEGSDFKLAFNNLTDDSTLRVQILDSSGSRVLADNQGNKEQQAAFAQLTSDSGFKANPGQYIVKVGYGDGADRSKIEDYNFQLFSGSFYINEYKTTASAQTVQNLLLSGGTLGYNPRTAAVALLTSQLNGNFTDPFGNADIFSTNFFA